jgi:hypothetical protein
MIHPESSDPEESRDDTHSPKRQKLSASQGAETALNCRGGRSPSVISDYNEVDSLESLCDDKTPSNANIYSHTTSGSALGASQICPQFVDINQEWEYRKIIGDEVVDGVPCYEMEWCSSLIPRASVRNKEVVAEYEARKVRARARCGASGKRRVRPHSKPCSQVIIEGGPSAGQ